MVLSIIIVLHAADGSLCMWQTTHDDNNNPSGARKGVILGYPTVYFTRMGMLMDLIIRDDWICDHHQYALMPKSAIPVLNIDDANNLSSQWAAVMRNKMMVTKTKLFTRFGDGMGRIARNYRSLKAGNAICMCPNKTRSLIF